MITQENAVWIAIVLAAIAVIGTIALIGPDLPRQRARRWPVIAIGLAAAATMLGLLLAVADFQHARRLDQRRAQPVDITDADRQAYARGTDALTRDLRRRQ